MERVFTTAGDEVLTNLIRIATRKIVHVAPGIRKPVAEALVSRLPELGRLSITVILDIDPEVCRLGYGDVDGLNILKTAADEHLLEIRHQPGVRVGILVSDDRTLIYAPTPLLIEAGSSTPEKPNAVLLDAPAAPLIERACASRSDHMPDEAEIGRSTVRTETIAEVQSDLAANPPKRFDIARTERVFNSRIQYVELTLTSYRISRKVAQIPADFIGLADDEELKDRWRNAFRLFDGAKPLSVKMPAIDPEGNPRPALGSGEPSNVDYTEAALEAERREINERYLTQVPKYGVFLLRASKPQFEKRIELFRARLKEFGAKLHARVNAEIDDSLQRLAQQLLPRAKVRPPASVRKYMPMSEADLKRFLFEQMRKNIPKMDDIFAPKLSINFKDVAYETIHDPEFRKAIKMAFPAHVADGMFTEHDAAPEATPSPKEM